MRHGKLAAQVSVIAINALALLWMLSTRVAPAQKGQGAGDTALRNGDVNCDGLFDITDAIATLTYLFQNGPEPCAIAQEEPDEIAVRQTALLERITFALEQDCDDWRDRFTDNGDGTITDHCRRLMWTKDNGHQNQRRLDQALADAESSEFAGYTNWRLPTADELMSLFRDNSEAIAVVPIFEANHGSYWTSTPHSEVSDSQWVVFFSSDDSSRRVRPLRAGEPDRGHWFRFVRELE